MGRPDLRICAASVDRYGIDEVSQWYFEVWNEPNLDFWAGDPKEQTYYRLYDTTARALKAVSPRLRVGGPATAQAAWVDRFIRHCVENQVPARFCFHPCLRERFGARMFSAPTRTFRATQMVCRAARESSRSGESLGAPGPAHHLERV